MTSESFVYWLNGYIEIASAGDAEASVSLNVKQMDIVRRHLAMVFIHDIDPKAGDVAHQAKLDEAHAGAQSPKPPPWAGGGHGPPGGPLIRC